MITTTDHHTAGEPFRIVTAGVPAIPGATVLDRRAAAQASAEIDAVRQLLVQEPRGHASMYGCFLVPPDDDGAEFGVLFWHQDGYSTACGHGTIALGAWAVRTGRVAAAPDGVTEVVMDVPSGRVTAAVTCAGGVVREVAFRNVARVCRGAGHRRVRHPRRRQLRRGDLCVGSGVFGGVGGASGASRGIDRRRTGDQAPPTAACPPARC